MILNSIITSEFSFWWLIVTVAISASLSFLLYRNDKYLKEVSKLVKYLLVGLRFLVLFFITFFLIKPFISSTKKEFFKPQLLILQDNSQSILLNKDSLYYKDDFIQKHQKLYEDLEKNDINYSVYSFSDTLVSNRKFKFNQKTTNISEALKQAIDLNIEHNIGGILLLSDGINNKGRDPYYLSKTLQVPIYTVGLGDTNSTSDVKIETIIINKIGFTEQQIPFSIDIASENIEESSATFSISENEKILFQKTININKSNFYQTIEKYLPSLPTGLHALEFKIDEQIGEYNIENNKQTVYINIVDSKQKILLLSSAPHPDIAAINSVLSKVSNIEFESYNIRNFKGQIEDYNLIILDQLPDKKNPISSILTKIKTNNTPVLSIVSNLTDLKHLNTLNADITFAHSLKKNEWLELEVNTEFSLFNLDDDLSEFLNQVPPIVAPMLKYKSENNNSILAYQKIKGIATEKPAILFTETENSKFGFILGEGLWKWKLFNFQNDGNFNQFTNLILKITQYLSIKTPKDAFIVDIKNQFEEYEAVEIHAQLYNSSLELVKNKEITFVYKDENKNEFKHSLSSKKSGYYTNLGMLKPGKYSYTISTKLKQKEISKSGFFVVVPSMLEHKQLTANHQLLKAISENTNGIYFDNDNWINIATTLKDNPHFKTKVYSTKSLSDLIHLKWILFLIVVLLSIEWFIRKYSGTI